jgi:hypothetical protein
MVEVIDMFEARERVPPGRFLRALTGRLSAATGSTSSSSAPVSRVATAQFKWVLRMA